jgi:hypothetical protein
MQGASSPRAVPPPPGARHPQVFDFSRYQPSPIYDVQLPNLPQKNKVKISLPKVNMSSIVLPGERPGGGTGGPCLGRPRLGLPCLGRVPLPSPGLPPQRSPCLLPFPPPRPATGPDTKDVVVVNVVPADLPPLHQTQVNVDLRNASMWKAPSPVKVVPSSSVENTRVSIVELPPIKVPEVPPVLTVDFRTNDTFADKIAEKMKAKNVTVPDLQVVAVTLPTIPKLGRDVNIDMGTINVDKFNPFNYNGDDGGLTEYVTGIDVKPPSFNRVPALNKPFITPGNLTVKQPVGGKGKGWGFSVNVEDKLSGGSPLTPFKPGASSGNFMKVAGDIAGSFTARGQYCSYKCCPACKPQPVKVEYAEPLYTCQAGCSYDPTERRCVCESAAKLPCPAGKKLCQVAAVGLTDLCVEASLHDKLCLASGTLCLAQNKVPVCPAA